MTTQKLIQVLQESLSSGTLHLSDEVVVYNSDSGDSYQISSAECDSQTSDFLIIIKD